MVTPERRWLMNPARHQQRARRLAATVAGVLVAALGWAVPTATAHAAPTIAARPAAHLGATAQSLLGDRTIGFYYDNASKQLIVTVTDDAAAAQVHALGAVPVKVPYHASELAAVTTQLALKARIPGTAWRIDPRTGQVLVTADSTVTGAKLASLTSVVKELGDKARLKITASTLRPLIAGGDAIWGQGLRCSLGFNVHDSSGNPAILTAGHCGVATNDWWADSGNNEHIATTAQADFPGTDYSYATYDQGVDAPSAVNTGQQISQAGDATVGEQVTRSGSTSGVHRDRPQCHRELPGRQRQRPDRHRRVRRARR
ncbi:streptogrisin-D [Kutzneria sp. 744]|nr:streptogrisin-D [Kutzneria sp. 744]